MAPDGIPMTHSPAAPQSRALSLFVEQLVVEYGAWTILRTAIFASLKRSRAPVSNLSNHLRRDIGLPPRIEEKADFWRYR
ncbi:hypothetical protein SAMN05421688_1259 [Poseidonocella pacifica]|uniref:DUF1127 domain-containing protein n=1 Tax=Poseidonocella pacifica TaxID=871651 RepID=A0A1I0WDI5_9RHOB|nr:hypothetical protein [Poseidonocella pacifica]SFA86230.1 hypothetical protein SAMN05421688_1259 [Poseidonocella pacifica]